MISTGRIKEEQSGELFVNLLKCKSWQISQNQVLAAYKAVKSKRGAGGVDGLNLEEFDKNDQNHL